MTQKKTMTLDEFAAYIQEELPKLMAEKYDPKQYKFSVFKVRKNNGVELTALSVSKLGETQWISPTFYVDGYFEDFRNGKISMDLVLKQTVEFFMTDYEIPDRNSVEDLGKIIKDFEKVKDKIIAVPVNVAKNKDLLKNVPHVMYLDFAVVYRIALSNNDDVFMSTLVSNEEFSSWDIPLHELHFTALKNSGKEFVCNSISIREYLVESVKAGMKEKRIPEEVIKAEIDTYISGFSEVFAENDRLTVVSNKQHVYGAAAILYDELFKNLLKNPDNILLIFPVSVNDIVTFSVMENPDIFPLLKDIAYIVCGQELSSSEFLSDNAYVYDKENGLRKLQ